MDNVEFPNPGCVPFTVDPAPLVVEVPYSIGFIMLGVEQPDGTTL
jgi:hypothetical protein